MKLNFLVSRFSVLEVCISEDQFLFSFSFLLVSSQFSVLSPHDLKFPGVLHICFFVT